MERRGGASADIELLADFLLRLGPDQFPDAESDARKIVETRWTEIEAGRLMQRETLPKPT